MALRTYDPNKIVVIVGGKQVTGFAEDTYLTAERDEAMWNKMIGVDGQGTRSKTNNYAGKVTLTLQHVSPGNDLMQALATADEQSNTGVVPVVVRDLQGNTLITCASAWIEKLPSVEYGKNVGSRAWVLDTDNLQMSVGGNV